MFDEEELGLNRPKLVKPIHELGRIWHFWPFAVSKSLDRRPGGKRHLVVRRQVRNAFPGVYIQGSF